AADPTLKAAFQQAASAPAPTPVTTAGLAAQSAQTQAPPKISDNGTRMGNDGITARGRMADPFDPGNQMPPLAIAPSPAKTEALALLARAEAEYKEKHYAQARQLFEQAHQVDPQCTAQSRDRWAYCRLSGVVEALNQAKGQACAWEALEKEV